MEAQHNHREDLAERVRSMNRAWLECRLDDLGTYLHDDVTMVMPGFGTRTSGREAMVAGFEDFCVTCRVDRYEERRLQADVVGDTGTCWFDFYLLYARGGSMYRSTGRDLWVFSRENGEWLAVWRSMLEVTDTRIGPA